MNKTIQTWELNRLENTSNSRNLITDTMLFMDNHNLKAKSEDDVQCSVYMYNLSSIFHGDLRGGTKIVAFRTETINI
jgi:hypothetical protein